MRFLLFILTLSSKIVFSQIDSAFYHAESIRFWEEQNEHYKHKKTSPLPKKERKAFSGHQYYDFKLSYVVYAKMVPVKNSDTIVMKTSSGAEKQYVRYGILHFSIKGVHCHLTAFQSLSLRVVEEYKNYLFIPFKDLTAGGETYGGGRYLDVTIPESSAMILNFNTAYNPYCAYTDGYSCPIPPDENKLSVSIEAGAKNPLH